VTGKRDFVGITKVIGLANRNRQRKIDDPHFLSGYSDASFHPDTHEGGFGAWVRDDRQRVIVSGPTPPWATTSNLAELAALFAATYIGVTRLDADRANIMVVKTDCQAVAKWFGWGGGQRLPKKHPDALRIIRDTWKLAEDHNLKLIVKWVKGHQGTGSTPGWLNDRVDKMARKARLSREKECYREIITPG